MIKNKQATEVGRPYAGETLLARTERRRQQFLDAGLELFGTIGYKAVTVRTLCKQAKLTDRYFYESFNNIDALLIAVYLQCIDHLQQQLLPIVSTLGSNTDLPSAINQSLDVFFSQIEDARVARVMWLEVLGVSPTIDQVYNQGINSFANLFSTLMRTIYPQWHIDDEELLILSIALVGAISQSTMFWLLSGYKSSRETMVAANAHLFLGFIAMVEKKLPSSQIN